MTKPVSQSQICTTVSSDNSTQPYPFDDGKDPYCDKTEHLLGEFYRLWIVTLYKLIRFITHPFCGNTGNGIFSKPWESRKNSKKIVFFQKRSYKFFWQLFASKCLFEFKSPLQKVLNLNWEDWVEVFFRLSYIAKKILAWTGKNAGCEVAEFLGPNLNNAFSWHIVSR